MTTINPIQSGTTTTAPDFEQKSNEEVEKIQKLQEDNPFSKFDRDGDGKISGTELAALKRVISGISFSTDPDGSIDSSAFNSAFKNAQYKAV